jgi:hypothetical protein
LPLFLIFGKREKYYPSKVETLHCNVCGQQFF